VHVQFDEATAILAGDALLAEGFRLALSYPAPVVARELAQGALGMIGGQHLDLSGVRDARVHRLKTGALFDAAVGCALWAASVPERDQAPWRAFGAELGLLYQIVDDILDQDGFAAEHGVDGARALADEAAERAQVRLAEVDAETSVLQELVAGLAARTS
jgi:geranylgeranyl pyrophosphate synthase